MNQHTHRTFPASHDGRHLRDAEVGDDAERDRLSLCRRERGDQRERSVEGALSITFVAGGRRRYVGDACGRLVGVSFPPFDRPDVVDAATRGDREQPAPEVVLAPVEPGKTRRDLDPYGRGQILGFGHTLGAEVAEEQMVVLAPERAERVGVALLRAPNHLFHISSIDHRSAVLQPRPQRAHVWS